MEPRSSSGRSAGTDLTADVDLGGVPRHCDLHDPRVRAEVEASLRAVPGLLSARIVPGFDRQVDELHVLAAADKPAKQAVRDVQTVLMARFGVPTDHRVISVVQLDETDHRSRPSRAAIDRLAITQAGPRVSIEVTLRHGDSEFVGTAATTSSNAARLRGVAHATLDAARALVADEVAVEVEGAEVAELLGRRVAVTLVHRRADRSDQTLTGSALVRDDEADAVARSVLDALNRSISDTIG